MTALNARVGEHSSLLDRKQDAKGSPDDFQSPAWILDALIPYLDPSWIVWEPACGHANLVHGFNARGFACVGTDILTGDDFLKDPRPRLAERFDFVATNPPYSGTLKEQFLARCYDLGRPFALLLPFTALEGKVRQTLYRKHGIELILFHKRVDFTVPGGNGSSSWFPVAFFTWGLNIGRGLTFWTPDPAQLSLPTDPPLPRPGAREVAG